MKQSIINIMLLLNKEKYPTYCVGGFVRDTIMGYTPNDIDIEVYNIDYENLADILSNFGQIDLIGKSFGIIQLVTHEGLKLDFSIPRIENKVGIGHTNFNCTFDKNITPYDAAQRRDYSINAMLMDVNGNIIDYFHGQEHLKMKILHPTSEAFKEDALRVLRGMQFASRFYLSASELTKQYAKEIFEDYKNISKDRIMHEWLKWAKSPYPFMGIKFLDDTEWINHYPQIANLKITQQNEKYHPEGNVYIHTMTVVEYAASVWQNKVITLAALCHDMGKIRYTVYNEQKEIISPGHNDPTDAILFCKSIGLPNDLTDKISILVKEHMFDTTNPSIKSIKRLINRLEGKVTINDLIKLIEADKNGRLTYYGKTEDLYAIEKIAEEIKLENGKIPPIIQGRDLINSGFKPSPLFGKVLDFVYNIQIDESIDSYSTLLNIAIKTMQLLDV